MDLKEVIKKTNLLRLYYGHENQMAKTVEELSELITELARTKTKPQPLQSDLIVNELADAMIMILQMWHQYGFDKCKYRMEGKLHKAIKNIQLERMSMSYDFCPLEDNVSLGE